MTRQYDDFLKLQCNTTIKEEQDGYYAFEETIFYGEKGGALSDEGWINQQPVVDLKWINDTLYHKVDGTLENPIHMEVNQDVRYINTAVQSALHIMDGYYEKRGLRILAIGVHPNNQWYEVDSKEIDETHLQEVQAFMNTIIRNPIKTEFQYIKGNEYPDERYQKFDEVRLVKFADINTQPCGTLHLNNTAQIESFVVLDYEKTSRGTRIFMTCNAVTNQRLKDYHQLLKRISQTLSVPKEEIETNIGHILSTSKTLKKEVDALKKELLTYKAKELLNKQEALLYYDTKDPNELRAIASTILSQIQQDTILYTIIQNELHFALLSIHDQARLYLEELKKAAETTGGGSLKIVTGKTQLSKEAFVSILTDCMKK